MTETPPEPAAAFSARPLWRSLDEREGAEEFRRWVAREFPERASQWAADAPSRREFLRLMAASLAMAGAAGCVRQPGETIVPAVEAPEHAPGGPPLYYASALPMTGGGLGVLVESHDGRPTKIEGNEQHPASLGATDIFAQAAVLGLYDPDRSQVIRRQGQISNWNTLLAELTRMGEQLRLRQGRGLRVLSPPILSPTLAAQRERLLNLFPEARWHEYEPADDDAARAGARMAFGEEVKPLYHFDQADVVLAIDADFQGFGPARVRAARDFARRRPMSAGTDATAASGGTDATAGSAGMSRLYVVESTVTLTGASADHRLPLRPEMVEPFVRELASRLGVGLESVATDGREPSSVPAEWWDAVLGDLTDESRRPLVLAGPWQPPVVHALVHIINERLGAAGQTVTYVEAPLRAADGQTASLVELVDSMQAGEVEALVILEANPVFTAPADLEFAAALKRVPFRLHFGTEFDETAAECTWHVAAAHWLESWGDVRAFDGTVSLIQPLIAPLYHGRNVYELLNVLLQQPEQSAYETLRQYWREQRGEDGFEAFWRQALHDGVLPESAYPAKTVSVRGNALAEINGTPPPAQNERTELTVLFRPHPTVWDGRFANNAWLQELPQPLTKLTWGNAALISPATATQHALVEGDVVELRVGDRRVEIPVAIVPAHPDGAVTLHFGCGRTRCGRVGTGVGTDVYPLRTTQGLWHAQVLLTKTGDRRPLPRTQNHFLMEGRDLVRAGTFEQYRANPEHPPFMHSGHGDHPQGSLYPEEHLDAPYQWGMAIDLTACIGCSACVIACQAENNIPVVGPQEVARGREMHWLRVDTYYAGEPENPTTYHQPVLCMHCEHAPCEPVCPVAATTHSDEGLNEMTYNRCIGTRYCSNNCPYKVRRFNFLDYHHETRDLPVLHLLQNPDVTVRSRGVMEKCTYCVQRINAARIQAELEDRTIRDGEIVTACQAVCPTQAIVFGNISDPESAVSRLKAHSLNYGLLEELNTRPRTTYLAALRNPHEDTEPR